MSADINRPPPVPPAPAAVPPSAVAEGTPPAPVTPAASETHTDKPAASDSKVTGLTPDQVLQELRKSGYVDQLRRQLFDAFASSAAEAPPTAVTGSATVDGSASHAATSASSGDSAPSASTAASAIDAASAPSQTTSVPPASVDTTPSNSIPTATASSSAPLNIATKSSFLTFLATPLRAAVEKEHSNLRLSEPREQRDSLQKALESDTVEHPHRETLGEATIYDLLVRHLVSAQGAGVLAREGKVGNEAWGRVGEVLDEMLNPAAKDEEGEEDDDDDDEEGEGEGEGEEGEAARTEVEAKPSEAAESLTSEGSQQAIAMDQD